ncbi:energy-coupling factor ABC transporter ATP-binding protein [Nocardiopsis terrae]|uniref:Energy-coupling factor transport system ATP-binding protein n=1 Tax=Nocardiopsis terrae TaxID=372655 RepID=A0ABR9HDH5_9ACTN|nr:ABC transporter ATP-binding protein [Nocardiopsis terrae]MBE1457075.1 energy-coupling factor transport system ATP-binding protein [Nocardiopsis terrae]GHC90483.1 energy-coupling factor ABC transporter ATP-binding protein [Nocardiopsis terrae]
MTGIDNTPAIEVSGLSFRYPGADRDSLTGVDLRIERGDFTAVVGGNGSGKTTLCKTFNGLVPHYWSGTFDGAVRVMGHDTRDLSVGALSHLVGYVYQDFGNQLVRPTARDEVSFAPVNFGLADHRERTEEALELLGVTHLADRFTWQLSGGQQHLVALAAIMALRPDVVVVDEPVAELDPAHADGIYEALADLNARLGTTVVVIEHHAEYVARHARSVVLMADGAPVWHLPAREAMERVAELERHGIPAPQVVRATRSLAPWAPVPLTVEEAAGHLREHFSDPGGGPGPLPPAAPPGTADSPGPRRPSGEPVAEMVGVRHGYREVGGGLAVVLHELDLTLRDGERVALVGGNGAGKSTLMRLFTGLKVPREGTVRVGGTDTRTVRPAALADRVCYLYQRPEQMFLKDNVREDVAMFPRGRGRSDTDALVADVLDRVDLTGLADRDGRLLSGGQQRRATLAIGLAMRPALLLLDEPTSSLDTASRDAVIAMLDALADTIRCTVVATHDMHLVAEWAHRVLVLDHGRIIADTTPAALFADQALMASVGLVAPQITRLGLSLGLNPPPLSVGEMLDRHQTTGRIRA